MSIQTYIALCPVFNRGHLKRHRHRIHHTRRPGYFTGIRSSVRSEPDHQHFHGEPTRFVQHDVSGPGSNPS